MNQTNIMRHVQFWLPPALLGLMLTATIAYIFADQNEREQIIHAEHLADLSEQLIQSRFKQFEYGLRGARGAIITSGVDTITRTQFETYMNSRDIALEFPGALGFGFIRRVPVDQEAHFLTQAREDGAPDFSIKTLTPHNGDRFVIQYIYPAQTNSQAVGLDIASESNRRNAALKAVRLGAMTLTPPIELVQSNGTRGYGALVLLPIFADRVQPDSPEEREKQVVGWSYAPLMLDDVLTGIDESLKKSVITLQSPGESSPFFSSANINLTPTSDIQVQREILILGQRAVSMSLTLHKETALEAAPWNVNLIIIIGLTFTTLITLLLSWLRRHGDSSSQNQEISDNNLDRIRAYLKSSLYQRTWPIVTLFSSILFILLIWTYIQNQFNNVKTDLTNAQGSAYSLLSKESANKQRDVLFLAKTPSVTGLMNIHEGPNYPVESQLWKSRIEDIFKAYMLATPEVYQVRFLEAHTNWQETAKVQRTNDELVSFHDGMLQNKKNEPYIQNTLDVGEGQVYISDINLNRENGSIEFPYRDVWRFATPVHNANGTPFGIIIINVNANKFLAKLASSIPETTDLYITDTRNEFVLHPEESRTFGYERNLSYKWEDEFETGEWWHRLDTTKLQSLHNSKGSVWVQHEYLRLAEDPNQRHLGIHSIYYQFPVYKKITVVSVTILLALTLLALAILSIQYWAWVIIGLFEHESRQSEAGKLRIKEMQRFKTILDSSPEASLIVEESGIIQMANGQAVKLFGYLREELVGHHVEKLLPADVRQRHKHHMAGYMQQPKMRPMGSNQELYGLKADGTQVPIEISLSGIQFDEQLLVSVTINDITERLKTSQRLQNALNDAQKATEAKSAFLANTSHEIRTPLNAIIGLTHLLSEERLSESQHQLVEKINLSGRSLLEIINDVLDLSKIEANEMTLESRPTELVELLEEIAGIFSVQADSKDLDFDLTIDPGFPDWVQVDGIRIRQILVNLLNNALKFTLRGKITLLAEVLSQHSEAGSNYILAKFSVADTGIGISAESQKRLFRPFSQADTSTTRRFGGTGLGLSIVSKLVELMGGSIDLDSTEGSGSRFCVEMLLRLTSMDDLSEQDNDSAGLFVLIAEDDPLDAKHIKKLIRALGWRSELVSNGLELLQAMNRRKADNMRLPDVIISDWKMPSMDGLTALQGLADQPDQERLPTILTLAASEHELIDMDQTETLIDRILHKPMDASILFNAINDIVTSHTGNIKKVMEATRSDAVKAKWLPGVSVLVVDDSFINLTVASNILEKNGAIVQTASSGEEALQLIDQNRDIYDAVLMDVQMPGIDGLETTSRVRESLGLTELPIIVLTAGAFQEERKRAMSMGINDFLTKPIDPSKLVSALRKAVEHYRERDILVQDVDKSGVGPLEEWPLIEGLNQNKARQMLLGDRQLFINTLSTVLQEHAPLAEPPSQDVDKADAKELRLSIASRVHKLRSGAGMIGAEHIHHLASKAEKQLRDGDSPVTELLTELADRLHALQQASAPVISSWKHSQQEALSTALKGTSQAITAEVAQHIINLLTDQDLEALDEVERHNIGLSSALGYEQFHQLQQLLMQLNYKQAITLLEPLTQGTLTGDIK